RVPHPCSTLPHLHSEARMTHGGTWCPTEEHPTAQRETAMPITPCGYAVGTGIFTPAEIHQMQTSITETINRLARGFLTPYATSCPELPLAERLERVAQLDRAYAVALVHGVFADV